MESNDEEVVYKHKIKRKSNFSRRQVETLLDEIMIHENQEILFSYNFTPYTNDQKEKIWKAITDKINDCEQLSEKRTISNVRRKWVNLLSFTKKRYLDDSQSIKIMTPIERRIINLVKERPSLWNDSKRSDFGADIPVHTITTTSLSPAEIRPTQDLLGQCATQAKRVYVPVQLQGVSNINSMHVKSIHSVSNSKNRGPTRSLRSDVDQDKDNSVLQRPQATAAINIQPTNEVGHMFIKQEVESEDEHCTQRNNGRLDIPTNSGPTIVNSERTHLYEMSGSSTHTELYTQLKLQLSSGTVNNEPYSGHQKPIESSTGALNNDSYSQHQRPIESSIRAHNNDSYSRLQRPIESSTGALNTDSYSQHQIPTDSSTDAPNNEPYSRQIFEDVTATQSNVPEINSDDFFCEFEKTERHNMLKRKRKIENCNGLSIEKERLVVERERLNVEKQRLEVEKRRLQIEEIRFKMEQERFKAKQ